MQGRCVKHSRNSLVQNAAIQRAESALQHCGDIQATLMELLVLLSAMFTFMCPEGSKQELRQ